MLWKQGRTVIRGGAGVFYDRTGPSTIGDLLHFNGVNLLGFIVTGPAHIVLYQKNIEAVLATEDGSGQADHDPDSLWTQDREAPRGHDLVRSG